eukprot:10643714-Ditylum_brightwellii.AAC.1
MHKRWILHCLSREAHWAVIMLTSTNETAKIIVLNLTHSYAMDKPNNLVQIHKAHTLIKAMHQAALIGKALNK